MFYNNKNCLLKKERLEAGCGLNFNNADRWTYSDIRDMARSRDATAAVNNNHLRASIISITVKFNGV